ncbi:Unknown protein sequence [Pseudomonas amygdali pv. lachrymans]|uniref:Uncharacterized protein n=1 Tax=Pseudomonas amygdali pv. lachrymans TaxID=53707 RepID=A0ABR5KL73_PSEAV|nr:Unknown protein sequence [Pseudomonas amygdali pv. lachrymans]KPC14952.1 Unknown protein sequence [Pseudomonas amygdali pv. lachrymans]
MSIDYRCRAHRSRFYTHVLMTIAPMLRIGEKICSRLVQQPIN